jgi:hypothetical protein
LTALDEQLQLLNVPLADSQEVSMVVNLRSNLTQQVRKLEGH